MIEKYTSKFYNLPIVIKNLSSERQFRDCNFCVFLFFHKLIQVYMSGNFLPFIGEIYCASLPKNCSLIRSAYASLLWLQLRDWSLWDMVYLIKNIFFFLRQYVCCCIIQVGLFLILYPHPLHFSFFHLLCFLKMIFLIR